MVFVAQFAAVRRTTLDASAGVQASRVVDDRQRRIRPSSKQVSDTSEDYAVTVENDHWEIATLNAAT